MATILMPNVLKIGKGVSRQLPDVLRKLRVNQPLLVTDAFVQKSGMMLPMEGALKESGISYHTFCGVIPDPTTDSLVPALELMSRKPLIDCVVGFGGGSSLDTAKVLAVLAKHPGPLRRHKVPAEVPDGLPVVAVPTTAGTGSEATKVAIVTDSETQEKMLCLGPGLLPAAALVDWELTLSKPKRLTADSGLDALCHALEAYVSRKANAFTDSLALTAMNTISSHLKRAYMAPSDSAAREHLMLAATQAGIAFSNSSVTLIHGNSAPRASGIGRMA
jgi:alcohol dehydrogenase class IV